MCMYAGSPLQKNAPIFGNVFTVTFYGVRVAILITVRNVQYCVLYITERYYVVINISITIHIYMNYVVMGGHYMGKQLRILALNTDVTVKTFPKIGAFFCKGLPACMHIGQASCLLCRWKKSST